MCDGAQTRGGNVADTVFAILDDLESFLENDVNSGLSYDDLIFILMLYADDMVLFGKSVADLQKSINLLSEYCDLWGLEVNTSKTKVMVFRRRGPSLNNEKWTFNGEQLDTVENFNYLGIVFNYTGSFSLNAESLAAGKGLKALNDLMNNLKNLDIKPSIVCQLFDAFVGATLNYGCEIWGFDKFNELERIHLKFCKMLLSIKSSSSSMGVYGELGRYPLNINRYVRIIKFWCKNVQSNNIIIAKLYDRFTKMQYCKSNWALNVKKLLDNYGFSHVWNNPSSVNLETFHIVFKSTVIDVFTQSWYNAINNSNSLMTYKLFKCRLEFESYLDLLPRKLRICLSKLQLSSHKLAIETGRHNRIERSLHYCTKCNTRDIEDEYHFIMVCPAFNLEFIKAYYYRRPSVFKFIELMGTSNKNKSKTSVHLYVERSTPLKYELDQSL